MKERHTLWHRAGGRERKGREYKTYRAAVKAGIGDLGHGKWWVESERKAKGNRAWESFAPAAIRMAVLIGEDNNPVNL